MKIANAMLKIQALDDKNLSAADSKIYVCKPEKQAQFMPSKRVQSSIARRPQPAPEGPKRS
jgi:hypothetical protein